MQGNGYTRKKGGERGEFKKAEGAQKKPFVVREDTAQPDNALHETDLSRRWTYHGETKEVIPGSIRKILKKKKKEVYAGQFSNPWGRG